MDERWRRIGWLYLIGVVAAAQLGKMSALIPLIGAELSLSLTVAALVVSLLEVSGATFGLVAGTLIPRIGRRQALLGGIALLAVGGIGEGLAGSTASLITWRFVESIGYLAIVIAAPLLIMETAGLDRRGPALALWSSFMPVGIALGAVLSGAAAEWFSWRAALIGGGVIGFLLLGVTAALPQPRRSTTAGRMPREWPGRQAWILAGSFGCYAAFEVGMLALLPTFLVGQAGATAAMAGLLTGAASFVTVIGSIVAAWQARAGRDNRLSMTISILLPALLLFFVFHDRPDLTQVATLVIVLNAVSGIFPGLAFAMLPRVAATDAEMAAANGLFTQFGASGSLIGPPLLASCAAWWGWSGAAAAGAVASAVCFALIMWATTAASTRRELAEFRS